MRLQLIEIIRRGNGSESRREHVIEAGTISIGRSAQCEVHIADPRVLLHQAVIEDRPGGVVIVAEPEAELLVNGRHEPAHALRLDDRIEFGPYRLTVRPAPEGFDISIKLTSLNAPADELAELAARSRTDFASIGFSKRGWSYLLGLCVLGVFILLPLVGQLFKPTHDGGMMNMASHWPGNADRVWISGEVSNPHKFFGNSCESCHQTPFVQVRDQACLSCHGNIQHHADPAEAMMVGLKNTACEGCHKEHNGAQGAILRADAFCTACHADLSKHMQKTKLLDASDFGRQHPQFRPTVQSDLADGGWMRASLDTNPPPRDLSGLKYPHDKHLVAAGVRHPELGNIKLECGNCHRPDSGGVSLLPIRFEADCHGCHKLRFDALAPDREMPHGDAKKAKAFIRDFYAARALQGGLEDPAAPEAVRRRPGQQMLTPAEKLEALAWAEAKSKSVLTGKFGPGLCGECHALKEGDDGLFDVAAPDIPLSWQPLSRFPHNRHREVACVDCHKAPTSIAATDLLLPGIATCRSCHGGEKASEKVASTCVSCHKFHQPGMPLMRHGTQAQMSPALGHPPLVSLAKGAAP